MLGVCLLAHGCVLLVYFSSEKVSVRVRVRACVILQKLATLHSGSLLPSPQTDNMTHIDFSCCVLPLNGGESVFFPFSFSFLFCSSLYSLVILSLFLRKRWVTVRRERDRGRREKKREMDRGRSKEEGGGGGGEG